jgi:iron(III) transport system permease protein
LSTSVAWGAGRGWRVSTWAIAAAVALPVLTIFAAWLLPAPEGLWSHLGTTVMPRVVMNTIVLLAGVLAGTFVLGVSLAWLTALTEFPGRRILAWALVAPMAMPAYVLGFIYCGLFDFAGPVQTLFRQWFGEAASLPSIRSTWGVILVMTLALYPYVYLISRSAFLTQGAKALETGRALGCSPGQAFWRLAVPLSRPWIFGALTLVAMETLADFGTVSMFVYETFTTAIYKTWYGFFSPVGAAQLASLLVLVVFVALWLQQRMERRKLYTGMGRCIGPPVRLVLSRRERWLAAVYAWGVLGFAFVMPVTQLLIWAAMAAKTDLDARLAGLAWHSVALGGMTAALATIFALIIATTARQERRASVAWAARIAVLGYALPGSVLAVGVFLPLVWLDQHVADLLARLLSRETELLLSGTVLAMLTGLTLRFLAVAHTAVASGVARIPRRLDEAAAGLGVKGLSALRRVHLPLLGSALVTGALLVFVDVMKEMPLTLMTRPFGWDTLAVRIFELTNEGQWERAALPATLLLCVGLVPVAWLSRGSIQDN